MMNNQNIRRSKRIQSQQQQLPPSPPSTPATKRQKKRKNMFYNIFNESKTERKRRKRRKSIGYDNGNKDYVLGEDENYLVGEDENYPMHIIQTALQFITKNNSYVSQFSSLPEFANIVETINQQVKQGGNGNKVDFGIQQIHQQIEQTNAKYQDVYDEMTNLLKHYCFVKKHKISIMVHNTKKKAFDMHCLPENRAWQLTVPEIFCILFYSDFNMIAEAMHLLVRGKPFNNKSIHLCDIRLIWQHIKSACTKPYRYEWLRKLASQGIVASYQGLRGVHGIQKGAGKFMGPQSFSLSSLIAMDFAFDPSTESIGCVLRFLLNKLNDKSKLYFIDISWISQYGEQEMLGWNIPTSCVTVFLNHAIFKATREAIMNGMHVN